MRLRGTLRATVALYMYAKVEWLLGCRGYRFMGLQEAPGVRYDLVDVRLRVLPGEFGYLGVRGEASNLHRALVWVRRHIIWRYQQRCLQGTHKVA